MLRMKNGAQHTTKIMNTIPITLEAFCSVWTSSSFLMCVFFISNMLVALRTNWCFLTSPLRLLVWPLGRINLVLVQGTISLDWSLDPWSILRWQLESDMLNSFVGIFLDWWWLSINGEVAHVPFWLEVSHMFSMLECKDVLGIDLRFIMGVYKCSSASSWWWVLRFLVWNRTLVPRFNGFLLRDLRMTGCSFSFPWAWSFWDWLINVYNVSP